MRSSFATETVTLRDGTQVVLRAIRPDDAPRLQALHKRLSPESVFLRFLDQRKALTDQDAQRWATVDYRTHMAIVAALPDGDDERLIGVARYAAIDPAKPDTAEAAIVVGRSPGTRPGHNPGQSIGDLRARAWHPRIRGERALQQQRDHALHPT